MSKLGVNKDNQKKVNRGMALKLIATGQCHSRIDLARQMGLTKTAISHIVNELIEKDVLVETRSRSTQELGRNPMGLGISPKMKRFVGLLVHRGFCEAVLCDIQLHMLRFERVEREWSSAEELLEAVYELVDKVIEGEDVLAIGVAALGPISVTDGMIVRPLYFNGISHIPIKALLEARYHLPVSFDHDSQSAVLAEHFYGNGRGYQDVFLASVGRGVGCGVVVGGHRIHSFTGYAPEIGHVSIDPRGIPCDCGSCGCLERYINSVDTLKRMRARTGLTLSYREFCLRADELPQVRAILDEMVDKFTLVLLNTLNILNSQIILLCMDCVFWPDDYVERIEQEINRKKFGNHDIHVPVRKVKFLERAQVLGAASNAIGEVFTGERGFSHESNETGVG